MEKNKPTLSEAEIELLKEALKRSYKERFEMATRLYKIQQTMSKASIVHKPFISK
jgi:rRNA maturation endonuclease Nob1